MLDKILRPALFLLLCSRIFFLLSAMVATFCIFQRRGYLGNYLNPHDPYLVWIWANFDGQHYLNIARWGYQQLATVGKFEFAFFPLYPSLISLLHHLLPLPHLYLGILISTASLFTAMLIIYKLARIDFNHHIAFLALFFLSFFPLSFFYHSVYTDSLFLFLTTASFYFARKKNWIISGVFGGLASFDRLSGLSLIPALLVEWYLQNRNLAKSKTKQVISALFLTFGGFFSYILYLQIHFGDWLLFQKSMIAWRQHEFVVPFQVIFRYLKIFLFLRPNILEYWIAVLEFISFFAYIFLAIYAWKKIRASYGVFMIVVLLLVTFTGTLSGGPRYTLHLFPGFIAMAILADRYKWLQFGLVLLFLLLGAILTALFTRGYFIA